MGPWKRAKARERTAGYRLGYAAGLRDARRAVWHEGSDRGWTPPLRRVYDVLRRMTDTAQTAADVMWSAASPPPMLTRLEAEDLWGYDPEQWPPWRCPTCKQRNARWALECGRCERPRTGDDHD